MSGDITQFLESQRTSIEEDKKRLGLLEQDEKVQCDNAANEYNNNKYTEQSIDENQENLHVNTGCVLSTNTSNKTLPFNEVLEFNTQYNANEEKKRAFIDRLVNAENPFTAQSNGTVGSGGTDTTSGGNGGSLPGCAMLRYGEYSPNNPQVRGAAQDPSAPFLGLGEYDQRRNYFLQKQRADYLKHLAKKSENLTEVSKDILSDKRPRVELQKSKSNSLLEKSVQTDLQNIHCQLIQYEPQYQKNTSSLHKEQLSPSVQQTGGFGNSTEDYFKLNNRKNLSSYSRVVDQRLTSAQNALLKRDIMDKPKSILSNRRTGSPRDRLLSDLYTPNSFADGYMGSSYHPTLAEEMERERLKRDAYQRELRAQIEEKRLARELKEERERAEREAENARLERQLLRMREERAAEERQRRGRRDEQMRRHSEDLLRRKQELQSRHGFRKHTDSESSLRNNHPSDNMASKMSLSHYSPPVSRRNPAAPSAPYSFNIPSTSVFAEPQARYNPNRFDSYHHRKDTLNRMDSLTSYEPPNRCSTFSRFDSLSRIDSLTHRIESINIRDGLNEGQRRHSATQQDLSMMTTRRGSPRLQRRSSSSRFEDSLPAPQVSKRSPVARELRHAIPCKSDSGLSNLRRSLEDSWLIPSVQKNSLDVPESSSSLRGVGDGQNRSILTQLGAIRMQLQQEQLRMDETLRKRGITQSKAVDFH